MGGRLGHTDLEGFLKFVRFVMAESTLAAFVGPPHASWSSSLLV
jgi:hypothetical protein